MISHLFFSFSFLICERDFLTQSSLSDMTRVLSSDKSSCSRSGMSGNSRGRRVSWLRHYDRWRMHEWLARIGLA